MPAGVPCAPAETVLLEVDPQPTVNKKRAKAGAAKTNRRLLFPAKARIATSPSNAGSHKGDAGKLPGKSWMRNAVAARAVVVTVTFTVAVAPLGLTDVGDRLQLLPVGAPEHESAIA